MIQPFFPVMAGRQAGGVETYEHGLIRGIARIEAERPIRVFCADERAELSFGIEQPNVRLQRLAPGWRPLAFSTGIARAARDLDGAPIHATYIPPLLRLPFTFTMHDCSVFDHPEFYHRRHRALLQFLQRRGVERAEQVICVSQTTRDRVAERFRVAPERLSVVYNGVDPRFRVLSESELGNLPEPKAPDSLNRRFGLTRNYLLYVGQLRLEHKNLGRLLQAFDRFRHETSERFQLVLVGKRSWTTGPLDEAIAALDHGKDVRVTGHVSDEDLVGIYNGARMLAFPSLSEGFGCSVIEAMACGTPVVTSNLSCLPEIAGGAARLVDPTSVEDIAAGISEVATDAGQAAELRERGLARAAHFSWDRCAKETLDRLRRE